MAGPSSPQSPAMSSPRGPWILLGGLLVAAVAIVVAVPLLVPGIGFGVAVHEVCRTGGEVESEQFWTPVVLVNSPYGGQAWGNATSPDYADPIVYVANGQARVAVESLTWQLDRLVNGSAAGPGVSSPCAAGFAATSTGYGAGVSAVQLLPNGTSTDVGEPTSFTFAGLSSVIFNPTPYTGSSGGVQIDNCEGITTGEQTASSSVYPITIPFSGPGTSHYVGVLFPASATYAYKFPVRGMWAADFAATDAQGQYEGGWTFTSVSCTAVPPPG